MRLTKQLLTVLIAFITLNAYSQLNYDSLNFEAEVLSIYNGKERKTVATNTKFHIDSTSVYNTERNQFWKINFKEELEKTSLKNGKEAYGTIGIDNAGYECLFYISHIHTSDPLITISYLNDNDVTFIYHVKPYKENFLQAESIKEIKMHEMYRDYTKEEVKEFLELFGDPEVIKALMIREILNDM